MTRWKSRGGSHCCLESKDKARWEYFEDGMPVMKTEGHHRQPVFITGHENA